ncbi:hypothetical protein D9611_006241 [Ephemerocybe angulata]|uniref:Uncharacterized protein n=1 Tax=Ephemerocybe angulata TaxID=980116 RepID=A0A8H5C752_9AGAR|nr:hypothetical protein D9611_006241 [Tulosesus angulatus]
MSGVTNNPDGKNQYKDCPSKGDLKTAELLRDYHHAGKTNRDLVSNLLRRDHGISMSPATVARRWKAMALVGSTATTRDMAPEVRRQYVADACAKDPAARQGVGSIRENVRLDSKVHLTYKCIREEMRVLNPGAFATRDPNSKKIHRTNLVSPGPHAEWSADGHDKLKEAGYPIWGIRDKWSRKWIGLWVVPCNRTLEIIGYCYLSAILNVGGRPEQSTTDCGSETTLMYGLAMALAEFARQAAAAGEAGGGGDGDAEADDEGPVHQFLKSIRNITIERGWVSLKTVVVDNLRMWWRLL